MTGDQLDNAGIVTMCGQLLAAGNVTTIDLIGNGVSTLQRHRVQLQKLRDDSSLIKNPVEDIMGARAREYAEQCFSAARFEANLGPNFLRVSARRPVSAV